MCEGGGECGLDQGGPGRVVLTPAHFLRRALSAAPQTEDQSEHPGLSAPGSEGTTLPAGLLRRQETALVRREGLPHPQPLGPLHVRLLPAGVKTPGDPRPHTVSGQVNTRVSTFCTFFGIWGYFTKK